jgi:tetratricopeptide (TPR) repeat protein
MAVAAGAVVVLALVAGTGFALQGMWRAQAAEKRAAADARAAEQVASFLTNLFREVDPTRRSADLTLRDLLDRGAEAIKSLADEPRTQARLQVTMGDVYTRIGAWDPALPLLEEAVDTRRRLGSDPADLIESLSLLGTLHEQAGRADAARAALLEAVAIGQERLGSEAAGLALPLRRLAALEMRTGRHAEAETLARRSLAIVERYQGPDSRDTVSALNLIGASLGARGDIVAAEPYLTRGFQGLEQTVGPDASNLVGPMNNLSNVYRRVGKAEDAERMATRGLALAERHYAPDAPQVAMLLSTRALALVALGRPAEAEPLLLRSLSIDRARRGESPEVADDLRALAHVQAVTGRFVEAEASFREAVAILDRTLDPTATPIAETLQELAAFLRARNRAAEAAALENRAARIRAPARN